jgi:hypothetical protein
MADYESVTIPKEVREKEFCKKLFKIEPIVDLAHDVTGCGRFAEVTETSDGFFLGRARGDIGFNEFLAQPSPRALENTKRIFDQLDSEGKIEFCSRVIVQRITPEDININCERLKSLQAIVMGDSEVDKAERREEEKHSRAMRMNVEEAEGGW